MPVNIKLRRPWAAGNYGCSLNPVRLWLVIILCCLLLLQMQPVCAGVNSGCIVVVCIITMCEKWHENQPFC
jgi:hypothetical protein